METNIRLGTQGGQLRRGVNYRLLRSARGGRGATLRRADLRRLGGILQADPPAAVVRAPGPDPLRDRRPAPGAARYGRPAEGQRSAGHPAAGPEGEVAPAFGRRQRTAERLHHMLDLVFFGRESVEINAPGVGGRGRCCCRAS